MCMMSDDMCMRSVQILLWAVSNTFLSWIPGRSWLDWILGWSGLSTDKVCDLQEHPAVLPQSSEPSRGWVNISWRWGFLVAWKVSGRFGTPGWPQFLAQKLSENDWIDGAFYKIYKMSVSSKNWTLRISKLSFGVFGRSNKVILETPTPPPLEAPGHWRWLDDGPQQWKQSTKPSCMLGSRPEKLQLMGCGKTWCAMVQLTKLAIPLYIYNDFWKLW